MRYRPNPITWRRGKGFISGNSAAQVKDSSPSLSVRKDHFRLLYHLTLIRLYEMHTHLQDVQGRQRTRDGLLLFSVQKHMTVTMVICSSSPPHNNNPKVFSTQRRTFTPGEELKTFKIFSWIDFFPFNSVQIITDIQTTHTILQRTLVDSYRGNEVLMVIVTAITVITDLQ